MRLILRDELEIAEPLLDRVAALTDADLLDCIRHATGAHRRLIAQRRGVSEVVAEALVEVGETLVVEALLRNDQARLSPARDRDRWSPMTQNQRQLAPLLLRRPRAAAQPRLRAVLVGRRRRAGGTILQRFAVSREVLQEAAGDVFPLAAEENWQDALTRKALQFIERRQRNRAAIDKSPYDSLEAAVSAAEPGLTREIAEEIAYLAGHQADDRRQDHHRPGRRRPGHAVQGHRPAARRRCARCGAPCAGPRSTESGEVAPRWRG